MVAVVVVLLGIGIVAVSVASRPARESPAGAGPAAWSPAYAATFESACAATGAGLSYCRCARAALENRIAEAAMVRFQRRQAAGQSLDAATQRVFREVEAGCGR